MIVRAPRASPDRQMSPRRTTRSPKPAAQKEASSRAQAKIETRSALIRAGIEAFAAEGLDAPSLDAICRRAGKTRGAFYVHFEDRDDFIVGVMEHLFQVYFDAIIAAGDAADDLEKTVKTYIAASDVSSFPLQGMVPAHQFLAACARSEQIRSRFTAILADALDRVRRAAQKGQEAGAVRTDVEPHEIALVLLLVASGIQSLSEVAAGLDFVGAANDLSKLLWRA